MKKTVTSSIGRVAFHVEEDAHQKLSKYLDDISQSLRSSSGHDEIMADIEARIAELLLQRIKDPQQVVTMQEVDEIIAIMGTPDAFATGESSKKQESANNTANTSYTYYGHKRVFRDPDDKVLFGVCSGIAHHFGIDPLWIRLALVLSFLLFGFGFLLYIILAIIIPKARTSAEKLEMRGQPVDLNNIKRTVEEELNDLKQRVENVKSDFQSGRYRNTGRDFGRNVGDFFSSVGHGVGGVLGGILRGVFAFVGFLLLFIFSIILIVLMVALFSGINVVHLHTGNGHMVHYSMYDIVSALAITGPDKSMLLIGLALFVGVPLVALIIRMGRTVMGIQSRIKAISITLFIGWMVGLVLILIVTMQTFGHFSVSGTSRAEVKFNTPAKTLYVNMPAMERGDISINVDSLNFYISEGNIFQGTPSLCIQPSADSNFHLVTNKYARGISQAEATESAKNIEYNFSQHDSTLNLSPFFQLEQGTGWRKQKMELSLMVPINKVIALPEGIDRIMCSTVHREHHHIGGHTWLMQQSGLVEADSLKMK